MKVMKKWYLIKTKPRQEKIAVYNLENQNFHVYCPFAFINSKFVALFPGYVFINLDENIQNFSPIRSTKGVLHFIKFGQNLAKIPDSIIDFIRENENSTSRKIKNLNEFKKGDKILITEGVFKNCIAIFKSIKSDDRVLLLLEMMGKEQTININKKSLIGL